MMTKFEFMESFAPILVVFNSECNKAVLRIYYELLKNYDPTALKMASLEILRTYQYANLPKPAIFLDILENRKGEVFEAWEQVRYAISRYGAYESVVFQNAKIMRVIELLGGWVRVADADESELKFIAKDFERIYNSLSSKNTNITHLHGLFELENKSPNQKVYIIGGKHHAKTISLENLQKSQAKQISEGVAKINLLAESKAI